MIRSTNSSDVLANFSALMISKTVVAEIVCLIRLKISSEVANPELQTISTCFVTLIFQKRVENESLEMTLHLLSRRVQSFSSPPIAYFVNVNMVEYCFLINRNKGFLTNMPFFRRWIIGTICESSACNNKLSCVKSVSSKRDIFSIISSVVSITLASLFP